MRQGQQDFLEAVDDIRRRMGEWRRGERLTRRVPEEFWSEAVGLANQYGIGRICQALGLDYKGLKKRMPSQLQVAASPPPAFLEWISPATATIEQCILELETGRGAKLRLEMKGVPASGLATLLREFAV